MRDQDRASLGLSPYRFCPQGAPTQCDFRPLRAQGTESIHICWTCGHGVTRPAMADVTHLYTGRESQDFQQDDGSVSLAIKRIAFKRQARQVLRELPSGTVPRTIVDFACGSGLFTRMLAEVVGADAQVHALDFFDAAPRDMGSVHYRPFAQMDALAGQADLLLCFHALEHDDDPFGFMARLLPLMRPGGYLVIEVPNVDCLWAPVFGEAWDNWYLPYHRLHFSRRSFAALIEQVGLELVSQRNISVPSMGRSLARATGASNTLAFLLAGAALHPAQLAGEKVSGRPSALRICARKPFPAA